MLIRVTQEMIDDSCERGGGAYDCPIALGMKQAGYTNVSVGPDFAIGKSSAGRIREFELSPTARNFIHYFDEGLREGVKPDVRPNDFILTEVKE